VLIPGAPSGELVLGRYWLEERLGAGGFGVVWRARDERLEREVAIKVIPRADDAGAGDRPFREARAAARLNHPGIVALYEMGADAESVLLVSELVRGRTFAELVRAGAVSDRDVARVGIALTDALGHAHDRGVIHRDVKPQNVIVVAKPSAGAGFAKLTDFGVAHLVGDSPLTRTGDIVGTLAYMAPEQAEGRRPTVACDTYALALTLYEALSGENPMRGRSPAETARLVGRHAPPLRGLRRDLPRDLCATIDACLEPRPDRRAPLGELGEAIAEGAPDLDARGGLVDPSTLARFGLLRREEREECEPAVPRTAPTRRESRTPDPRPAERRSYPDERLGEPYERRRPRWAPALPPPARHADPDGQVRRPRLERLVPRAIAAAGAAALVAATFSVIGVEPPVSAATAAGTSAVAAAVLPRSAWLVTAGGLLAWAVVGAGLDGAALVALAPLAATPLLLPRAGAAWSLPALAPLLGTIGLGPAFAALAGLASTSFRRAGLAAAGALWLVAAEAMSGERLFQGAPAAVPAPSSWVGSVSAAATQVLPPLAAPGVLAPALVWGAAAVLLPLAVRGRAPLPDLGRGALWAGGLIAAGLALADVAGLDGAAGEPRGAVAGPLLGLVAGLLVTRVRRGPYEAPPGVRERPPADAFGAPPVA
jgi:eukaryotic-like serine/threonine-protein kinase